MDIAHAILSKETTTGFCLYNIPEKDVIFLEKFDDSSIKQKMHIDAIVKVRLTYYKRKQKVSGLKKTSNQVVEHKMNINNRDFSYLLTEGLNYYYISASPITN
ncbi:MAG: hypothetical protein JSS82_10660 [Bacteroidetes bacterium]|nr:hypothetical protein [Bacteroidota bacterium]